MDLNIDLKIQIQLFRVANVLSNKIQIKLIFAWKMSMLSRDFVL